MKTSTPLKATMAVGRDGVRKHIAAHQEADRQYVALGIRLSKNATCYRGRR